MYYHKEYTRMRRKFTKRMPLLRYL